MKRRDFLKTSAIIGGTTATSAHIFSCSDQYEKENRIQYMEGEQLPVTLLKGMDNGYLRVDIFSDASVKIIDKKNDILWKIGPVAIQEYGPIEEGHVWMVQERSMCQQYPGRFHGRKLNDKLIEFTVIGRQNRIRGKFNCEISLHDEWLTYRITDIDNELNSLIFPPPVESDYILTPQGIGKCTKNVTSRGIYPRYIRTFWTHLNMRWIGGVKDDAAWMCVYDEGYEDACALEANRNISPGYMQTLGEWKHPYMVKYKFIKGNYVTLAKCYREYVKRKGWFKTLDDKIKENKELLKMKGGRAFWMTLASGVPRKTDVDDYLLSPGQKEGYHMGEDVHVRITYKQARALIDEYKRLGMKKGFVKIAGWINKGYDWSHPDVWPPEPKLGKINELKGLMEMEGDILTGLHDNYQDMYEGLPSWPKGVVRQKDGSLMIGGFWAGGQSYVMHYRNSIEYARRNWEKIKTLNPKAMFCDTATAMQLYQSYEKGNMLTKQHDREAKEDFMRFYKKEGQVFGSEEVAEFGVPYVDWFETRFKRTEGDYLPLWPLVFHDTAFITRYGSSGVGGDYPKWLEDMLWGTMLHFSSKLEFDKKYFTSTFHVDKWHEKVGTAEMTNHQFLTGDNKVEQTEFSSGHAIIVNFSDEDRMIEGKHIGARDYRILS